MLTTPPSRHVVQGLTFALWAFAAGSAVYWGFKLAAPAAPLPVLASGSRAAPVPDPAAIARLLGSSPVSNVPQMAIPSLSSRFSLMGVVARASRAGVALISVDGKPAKPYRVGSTVDEGLVLQSVEARRASLGAAATGPSLITLELPRGSGRMELPAMPRGSYLPLSPSPAPR